MTKTVSGLIGALVFGTCSWPALAVDSVKIRIASGYPPPHLSSELVDLDISRIPARWKAEERDIDIFFAAVRAILKTCQITESWQLISPDTPFVRLEIALDGRNISLVTDRFGLRPEPNRDFDAPLCDTPGQNANDRNRAAFDRILELSLERIRTRMGK